MGEVLTEMEGSNGRVYEITRGMDGVVYCGCMAWKMSKSKPKNCKHLDRYFANSNGSQPVPTLPTPVPAITGSMKSASDVISAVDPKTWDVEEGS